MEKYIAKTLNFKSLGRNGEIKEGNLKKAIEEAWGSNEKWKRPNWFGRFLFLVRFV